MRSRSGHAIQTSTRWLLGELAVIVLAMGALGALSFPLFLPYRWHLLLHITGGIMFLGNIVITGVWMALAVRTQDWSTVRFAARIVNWMDVRFTVPGIFLILWNGLTLVSRLGGVFGESWIVLGGILFSVSGVVYLAFTVPDQERLARLASDAETSPWPDMRFMRVFRRWIVAGVVATVLPGLSYALMVLRPALW